MTKTPMNVETSHYILCAVPVSLIWRPLHFHLYSYFHIYAAGTGVHESNCKCCQPTKLKDIEVELTCLNGTTTVSKVPVPYACSCDVCSETNYVKATPGEDLLLKEADQ